MKNLTRIVIFQFFISLLSKQLIARQQLTLAHAFTIALQDNRSLKLEEKRILSAKKDATFLHFTPNINVGLSMSHDLSKKKDSNKTVGFSLPINFLEKTMNFFQKKQNVKIAKADLSLKVLEKLAEIAKKFYSTLAMQNVLKFWEEQLNIAKNKLSESRKKNSLGKISQIELDHDVLNYNMASAELLKKKNDFEEEKLNLKTAIDFQGNEDFEVFGEINVEEEFLEKINTLTIGDIHNEQFNQQRQLHRLKRKSLYLNLIPSLSTDFSMSLSNDNIGGSGNYHLGVSLNLDLYKCIIANSELDKIDIEADKKILEESMQISLLRKKLKTSLKKFQSLAQLLKISQQNYSLSLNIYKEYEKKFELKLITQLEMDEAKNSFHKAKIFLEETKLNLKMLQIEILFIAGDKDLLLEV